MVLVTIGGQGKTEFLETGVVMERKCERQPENQRKSVSGGQRNPEEYMDMKHIF